MQLKHFDYWDEAVRIALDDVGLKASDEQIQEIAGSMEGSHENYGQSMGHDVASANLVSADKSEIARLKRELETALDTAADVPGLAKTNQDQDWEIKRLRRVVVNLQEESS